MKNQTKRKSNSKMAKLFADKDIVVVEWYDIVSNNNCNISWYDSQPMFSCGILLPEIKENETITYIRLASTVAPLDEDATNDIIIIPKGAIRKMTYMGYIDDKGSIISGKRK